MVRLIVFDVDGTLVESHTDRLLPGVLPFFQLVFSNPCQADSPPALAIATNQGGVGMRYLMEQKHFGHPERYPTEEEIDGRLNRLAMELGGAGKIHIYVAFRFKNPFGKWSPLPPEKSGDPRWAEGWRKPEPGMLRRAMEDAGATPAQTLFVGDRAEDRGAAKAAGVAFEWARDFFARDWENCNHLKEILK